MPITTGAIVAFWMKIEAYRQRSINHPGMAITFCGRCCVFMFLPLYGSIINLTIEFVYGDLNYYLALLATLDHFRVNKL